MNKYEAYQLHQKTRKTKQYNGHIVDEELSEDGLDKVNSFKPEINVHSVCIGHYYTHEFPSLSFKYKGKKSIIDVYIQLSKIKDTEIIHRKINMMLRTMNIFHIKYKCKKEDFLDEIYENFKEIRG